MSLFVTYYLLCLQQFGYKIYVQLCGVVSLSDHCKQKCLEINKPKNTFFKKCNTVNDLLAP